MHLVISHCITVTNISNKLCLQYIKGVASLLLKLTMQFDSQLIGRPSKGHASSGGRTWKGGAAEENVSGESRFRNGVAQGGKALATINALI